MLGEQSTTEPKPLPSSLPGVYIYFSSIGIGKKNSYIAGCGGTHL
jgi:hypothetical protein